MYASRQVNLPLVITMRYLPERAQRTGPTADVVVVGVGVDDDTADVDVDAAVDTEGGADVLLADVAVDGGVDRDVGVPLLHPAASNITSSADPMAAARCMRASLAACADTAQHAVATPSGDAPRYIHRRAGPRAAPRRPIRPVRVPANRPRI